MPNKNKRNPTQSREYYCPLCHATTHGRLGLKIHLKDHYKDVFKTNLSKLNKNKKIPFAEKTKQQQEIEIKIENLVVKTIFGQSQVDRITKQYLDGVYTLRNLPINIGNYLILNGYSKKKKELNAKDDASTEVKSKKKEEKIDKYLTIHKLLSINCNAICKICLNVQDEGYLAIKDMIFVSNNDVKLTLSDNIEEMITAEVAGKYLKTYNENYSQIANNHFYCTFDGKKRYIESAKLKDGYIILKI